MNQSVENWQRVLSLLANDEGRVTLLPTESADAITSVLEQHQCGLLDEREAELYLSLFGNGLEPNIVVAEDGSQAICWGVPDNKEARANWTQLGIYLHKMARGFEESEE